MYYLWIVAYLAVTIHWPTQAPSTYRTTKAVPIVTHLSYFFK